MIVPLHEVVPDEIKILVRHIDGQLLKRVDITDERFKTNSKLPLKFVGEPGVKLIENGVLLTPSQIAHGNATVLINASSMLELANNANLSLVAELNEDTLESPAIGQRCPNQSRINGIIKAWGNESITPRNHVDVISLYVYNSKVNEDGIFLTKDSLVCIGDGGGRTQALMQDKAQVAINHNIWFALTIDLYGGNASRQNKQFLKLNDQGKRPTRATILGIENGLLSTDITTKPKSMNDPYARTYIADELFNKYRTDNSWMRFVRWSTEAGTKGDGRGTITSVAGAFNGLKKELSDFPIELLSKTLDFGFKCFYRICPGAVKDVLENEGKTHKFHTTLACKAIMLITVLYAKHELKNKRIPIARSFDDFLNKLFTEHYLHYKKDYISKLGKKITADDFFCNSWFFNNKGFNSSLAATGKMMKELRQSFKDAIEKL